MKSVFHIWLSVAPRAFCANYKGSPMGDITGNSHDGQKPLKVMHAKPSTTQTMCAILGTINNKYL